MNEWPTQCLANEWATNEEVESSQKDSSKTEEKERKHGKGAWRGSREKEGELAGGGQTDGSDGDGSVERQVGR